MWATPLLVVLVTIAYGTGFGQALLLYGSCPHFIPPGYPDTLVQLFLGKQGDLLYFSNIRFESLFDGQSEIEELYVSNYTIVLEQRPLDECFVPFRLEAKASYQAPYRSHRHGTLTLLNAIVLDVIDKEFLLAFSCVQLGHTKLEYVWVFKRAGRIGRPGLTKVEQMFGKWLTGMSTETRHLRRSHHDLIFCTSFLWTAIFCSAGVVLFALVLTIGIVCWKKHKQIERLRRQSCADYELQEDGCELDGGVNEAERSTRRNAMASAKTIAVMNWPSGGEY